MKLEEFKSCYPLRNVRIIKKSNVPSHLIQEYKELRNFFQHVDFGCEINNGGCRIHPKSITCCCNDCFHSIGYFNIMFDTDLKYYARRFADPRKHANKRKRVGFWEEGKGCVLPHNMRSRICLTHHCNNSSYPSYDPKKFGGFRRAMNILREAIWQVEKKIRECDQ